MRVPGADCLGHMSRCSDACKAGRVHQIDHLINADAVVACRGWHDIKGIPDDVESTAGEIGRDQVLVRCIAPRHQWRMCLGENHAVGFPRHEVDRHVPQPQECLSVERLRVTPIGRVIPLPSSGAGEVSSKICER